MDKMEDMQYVPFAAYEAQAERNVRAIKYMSIGWVFSVVVLVMALVVALSYQIDTEDELVTTTTTTTTSSDVAQDSGDGGNNNYYGGDYYGEADSQANS